MKLFDMVPTDHLQNVTSMACDLLQKTAYRLVIDITAGVGRLGSLHIEASDDGETFIPLSSLSVGDDAVYSETRVKNQKKEYLRARYISESGQGGLMTVIVYS